MKNPNATEKPIGGAYRFNVIADPDGGYVIEYPDLPGCITQAETIGEVGTAAQEILELWIEAAIEQGMPIPEPSYPASYSGKFNLRLPKSMHRRLAQQAVAEGVSLNQLAVAFIAGGLGAPGHPAMVQPRSGVMRAAEEAGEYDSSAD